MTQCIWGHGWKEGSWTEFQFDEGTPGSYHSAFLRLHRDLPEHCILSKRVLRLYHVTQWNARTMPFRQWVSRLHRLLRTTIKRYSLSSFQGSLESSYTFCRSKSHIHYWAIRLKNIFWRTCHFWKSLLEYFNNIQIQILSLEIGFSQTFFFSHLFTRTLF